MTNHNAAIYVACPLEKTPPLLRKFGEQGVCKDCRIQVIYSADSFALATAISKKASIPLVTLCPECANKERLQLESDGKKCPTVVLQDEDLDKAMEKAVAESN